MTQLPPLTILGDTTQAGTYLLRIHVTQPLNMQFGRFKKGKLIAVPEGEYLYLGSALGKRGAVSLARRLVRHATRSRPHPPHTIRAPLLTLCEEIGLGQGDLRPKQGKTCHWNIDYLLDHLTVHLTHIIAIRNPRRLEADLAQQLAHMPETHILEKGLGANDLPGSTHLLRVTGDEAWWIALPEKITPLFA